MMNDPTIRLTRQQVREIDRLAMQKYHIPGIVLMENAARAVADEVARSAEGMKRRIAVVCGGGNNGGDGFAVARHLHNRGLDVEVVLLVDPSNIVGDAAINLRIVQQMNLPVTFGTMRSRLSNHALIVDAMLGTGLNRTVESPYSEVIEQINAAQLPVIAVDLPSGMDCDSGEPLGACIRATVTVTFVAEKTGFSHPLASQYTGRVVVGDIGAPVELTREVIRAL